MKASKLLRQASVHFERTPLIKFLGPRAIPSAVDHTPRPHPASPTGRLPDGFVSRDNSSSRHNSFSAYRDHAQQHGPLQKTIRVTGAGIGDASGVELGSIQPPTGVAFDSSELPLRFRRRPIDSIEIEAIESGGAATLV